MPNYFFSPQVYPFMFENEVIGFFTVDMNSHGKYEYTVDIVSYVEINKIPWGFLNYNNEFISKYKDSYHHKSVVLNWIEERIFPEERQGSDELLNKLNLLEYDQFQVLKNTRASSRYDNYWIKFFADDTYKKTILKRWPLKNDIHK
ncbi:hypothetical protein SFC55_25025 [Niallia taxi]|uniref:hypothetical protein n=1 Tax=Niallia taxi TaxID=2499688 RepID=UPI003982CCEF